MQELKNRIVKEGKVLPGNIIKVDGFLNHRVDTGLMDRIAEEFGRHFNMDEVTVILTAEASGIALSAVVARHFQKPMIFAKKAKSDNIEGGLYQSDIFSYTYKKKVTLLVSKEWLSADDKVLIIDDFMANGEAVRGLCGIVEKAEAALVGVGCAVEKGFQGGGDRLRAAGVNLKSLAIIESAEPGNIVFREEYGDSAYLGLEKWEEIKQNPQLSAVEYRINHRPGRLPQVSDNAIDWERTIERRKSAVRCKVEHPYRIVKNIFGFRKTVYCGLRKNLSRLHVLFASANLYMLVRAGGSLCPAWGSCTL